MRRPHHLRTERARRAEPTWLRVLAMVCVLLVAVSGCVQASHVHNDDGGPTLWKSSQGKTPGHAPGNTPTNAPDHCLLCAVMHAAMPSARGMAPVPVRHTQSPIPVALASRRVQRVSFDLFSRPPPAALPSPASSAGQAAEPRVL